VMKTIVQNLGDQSYLGEEFKWVREKEHAKAFHRSYDALDFCLQNKIKGVELLLLDEHGSEIVRLSRIC
jgi:hypothetical protein